MIKQFGGQFEFIPKSRISRIEIYENKNRKSMDEIKKELGCDIIQNCGFYTRKTFKPMNHLVIGGKIVSNSPGKVGASFKDDQIRFSYDNQVGYPYHVSGYPWLVLNGKLQTVFPEDLIPETQRGIFGETSDSIVLGTFTTPIELTELPAILVKVGCSSAINLDGGGSVQRNWNGQRYYSSRIVHNFICIWLKKEITPTTIKDDDGMNIIQDLIPKGRKNRPARVNPMKYITVHETDNFKKGANARSHGSYLKTDEAVKRQVSWHYTVDDTCIVQHIPDNEDAWHASDKSGDGNRKSIGVEICVNPDGDFAKAVQNAAELVAMLCKKHDIPIENVVQHYRWSKKDCPNRLRKGNPISWNSFIGKVENILSPKPVVTQKTDAPSDWAKNSWEKAKSIGILDGTRPTDPVTRQELAVVLDRLGLLKG